MARGGYRPRGSDCAGPRPAFGNERYLQVDLECVLSRLTWRGIGSSHVSAPLSALVRRGACQSERGAPGMHRGICSIQAHRNNSAGWVRPNGLGERLAMQPDPQIHGGTAITQSAVQARRSKSTRASSTGACCLKRQNRAIIAAGVRRFGHVINMDGVLGTHNASRSMRLFR
jgi:hypothetical protein